MKLHIIFITITRWVLSLLWLIMMLGAFSDGGFVGVIWGVLLLTALAYTCPPIHAQIKKLKAKQEQVELQKIQDDRAVIKDKLNHIKLCYLMPAKSVTSSVDIWKEQLEEINDNINYIKDKPLKSKTIRQYKELLPEFQAIDDAASPVYGARNSIKRIMGWIEDDTHSMADPNEIQECVNKHDEELEEYTQVIDEGQQLVDSVGNFDEKVNDLYHKTQQYLEDEK